MNPVDTYLDDKEKRAASRKSADEEAFNAWKSKPNATTTRALLKRFDSDMSKLVNRYSAGAKKVNQTGLRMDMKRNLMKAFQTWDPERASLRTHANNLMKRSQRYVNKFQNMAFIPEEKRALITPVKKAREMLHQQQGKEPSRDAIANYLNQNPTMVPKRVRGYMSGTLVKTVDDYQIKDVPGAAFETEPTRRGLSFEQEQASLLHTALTPQENQVYDYLVGRRGKPKITRTGEIANRLGIGAPQVSRIRKKIEQKYKKYL